MKAQFCDTRFETLIIMKLYLINYTFVVMFLPHACRVQRLAMLGIAPALVL
jgi:hypothetical protein